MLGTEECFMNCSAALIQREEKANTRRRLFMTIPLSRGTSTLFFFCFYRKEGRATSTLHCSSGVQRASAFGVAVISSSPLRVT